MHKKKEEETYKEGRGGRRKGATERRQRKRKRGKKEGRKKGEGEEELVIENAVDRGDRGRAGGLLRGFGGSSRPRRRLGLHLRHRSAGNSPARHAQRRRLAKP